MFTKFDNYKDSPRVDTSISKEICIALNVKHWKEHILKGYALLMAHRNFENRSIGA
jgi:hypothetical protein